MTPKKQTQTLYYVTSRRDGERVCGPFPKDVADRERKRLEAEQRERRQDDPIHAIRRGQSITIEPPEREIIRELARDAGRPDLLERIPDLAAAADVPGAGELNEVLDPTGYQLEKVEELAGFDPFSEEPHVEQRARLSGTER